MSFAWSRVVLGAAGAVLLVSCAGSEVAYYLPPQGLTADQAVSVYGSKDPKSIIGSSEYRLVWAVDGRQVKDSAYRWDQPLLLTAGQPHRLSLAYGWGAAAGTTVVDFTGQPGTTVVVKGESVDPEHEARLWIEDAATGRLRTASTASFAISAPTRRTPFTASPARLAGRSRSCSAVITACRSA